MSDYIIEEYLEYIQEVPGAGALAGASAIGASGGIGLAPVMAAVSIFSAFNMAFQLYKNYFSKAARRCKDLPAKEKAICMLKAKAMAKEAQLKALKQAAAKCAKTKNPVKCKQKFNAKMSKVGGEQGYLKSRMQQLSSQKYS